jgi:hypothetical protein
MGRGVRNLLLLLSLAACVSTSEPTTTPFIVERIVTTSELEGLVSGWLAAYIEETGRVNLLLELLPPQEMLSNLERGDAKVGFISGDVPTGWFATPLSKEAIAIIVNPQISNISLEVEEIEGLFSGRVKSWEDFTDDAFAIQPVIPFSGNVFRERFLREIMGSSLFDPSSLLGSTPDEILELVKSKPGAVGFIPIGQMDEEVTVVAISGVVPSANSVDSGTYPLWVDILAVSPQEPIGPVRDFLIWLQGTFMQSLEK